MPNQAAEAVSLAACQWDHCPSFFLLTHLLVRHELRPDRVILGLPEDVVEADDGALPLLEPHVLLRASQQDLVAGRRRRHVLTKEKLYLSTEDVFSLKLCGYTKNRL